MIAPELCFVYQLTLCSRPTTTKIRTTITTTSQPSTSWAPVPSSELSFQFPVDTRAANSSTESKEKIKMIIKTLAIVSLCLASIQAAPQAPGVPKKHLVCYYDSASFVKEGKYPVTLRFQRLYNNSGKLLISGEKIWQRNRKQASELIKKYLEIAVSSLLFIQVGCASDNMHWE